MHKFIQIIKDFCANFYFLTIFFLEAFDMSILSTLNALYKLKPSFSRLSPLFKTSIFPMTNMIALSTLNNISFFAVFGLMTNFVAFKTHFFSAFI
jgi:hypothetical protein